MKEIDEILSKNEQKGFLGLIALNRINGITYVFKKEFHFWLWQIVIEWRSVNNLWGRFGGGWNWELGIQVSRRTVIINLLILSIRIDRRKKEAKDEL